uniref:Uncharacterized protein n=1 Tax=Caenorhabditis tropicalis TaxID=1561998 RepID=A0A1I7URI5_9PELO
MSESSSMTKEVFPSDVLSVAIKKQSEPRRTKKDVSIRKELQEFLLIKKLNKEVEDRKVRKRDRTNILNAKKSTDKMEPGKKMAKDEGWIQKKKEEEEKVVEILEKLKIN